MALSITTSFYRNNNYFDVCEINGSKFALFSKQIECENTLSIDLSDHNVVFLAPIEANKNICIQAISVIALTHLHAKNGMMEIKATEKVILLGATVKSLLDNKISGKKGIFTYGVLTERLEMIREKFREGISNQHGRAIVNALIETFDAVEDPSGENESVNIPQAFNFFNISSDDSLESPAP